MTPSDISNSNFPHHLQLDRRCPLQRRLCICQSAVRQSIHAPTGHEEDLLAVRSSLFFSCPFDSCFQILVSRDLLQFHKLIIVLLIQDVEGLKLKF
jgi:hypothetical protein